MKSVNVIALLRKRQGKRTLTELANELGVSQPYLTDIFKGRRNPGPKILEQLGLEKETIVRSVEKSA